MSKAIDFLKSIDKIDYEINLDNGSKIYPENFQKFKKSHLEALENYDKNSRAYETHLNRVRKLYKKLKK